MKSLLKHKNTKRQLIAFAFSLALFTLMLSILLFQRELIDYQKDEVIIREVALSSPPPPPPPPRQQQTEDQPDMQLNVQGEGPPLTVSEIKVDEKLETLELQSPELASAVNDWNLELEVDWSAYGLDELDGVPSLLTSLKADFPRSLSSKGIERAIVRLNVFIDETGRLQLINIEENPYPELQDSIQRVIRNARFSVPKRGGEAVRARFIWPVEFTDT